MRFVHRKSHRRPPEAGDAGHKSGRSPTGLVWHTSVLAARSWFVAAFLAATVSSLPTVAQDQQFDFDDDGYYGLPDHLYFSLCLEVSGPGNRAEFTECRDAFDVVGDMDVDLADFAALQNARGHLPMPLLDLHGEVINVNDPNQFYDGRHTCGRCHDLAHIENGFLFQQGRTDTQGYIIIEDDCRNDGRPWVRSNGMYGAWRPRTNRLIASKHFANESDIDQSAFWWTSNCSGCHPGGGGMEFDQDGQRFYDIDTGQFGYEALGKTVEDVRYDVDYAHINANTGANFGQAPWSQTGVASPDCLMCHRLDRTWVNGWEMNRAWRSGVLAANASLVNDAGDPVPAFRAAATAGQGWFSNIVFTRFPDMYPLVSQLQVDYTRGLVDGSLMSDQDGNLSLNPASFAFPPTDQACWGCHQPSWIGKRGSVWFDTRDVHYAGFNKLRDDDPGNDIPAEKSRACRTCHPGDVNHNFAKGDSQFNMFRNDLDWNNMRSCRDCHLTVLPNDTPNPLHHPDAPAVPGDIHIHWVGFYEGDTGPMNTMSCQACHIPYALAATRMGVDNSVTGSGITYQAAQFLSADPLDPANPDRSRWYPEFRYKTDSDGATRLFPTKVDFAIYWGDWNQNGTPEDRGDDTIVPVILWRIKNITGNAPLPCATDDNGDGKMELNTPAEILCYIQALKGNDSYGRQVASNPVLVKGALAWFEDPGSPTGVSSFDHVQAGMNVEFEEIYELHPPVLVKEESWGYDLAAEGCRDCHRPDTFDSPVIDRKVLVDPWGLDGQPIYTTVRAMAGVNPS